MGLFSYIYKKLTAAIAAKALSPHSWEAKKYAKLPLTEQEVSKILPDLRRYLGETNFSTEYEKHRTAVISLEADVNFIDNEGEPLQRKVAFLLAFDLARVLAECSRHGIQNLKSVVVYPTYLPTQSNAAGLTLCRGPKGLIEDLGQIKNLVLSTDFVLAGKSESKLLVQELHKTFERIKGGMSERSLLEFKVLFNKIESFIVGHYTEEAIRLRREQAPAEYKSFMDQMIAPEVIHNYFSSIRSRWEEVQVPDEFSIHLSWANFLHQMSQSGQNLFIHELAHVLDSQNHYTFSIHQDTVWDELHKKYEKENEGFILGPYALTNTKEFFAVASEYYFRHPEHLREKHPDIFKALKKVYLHVPAEHPSPSATDILKLV